MTAIKYPSATSHPDDWMIYGTANTPSPMVAAATIAAMVKDFIDMPAVADDYAV